MHPDDVPTPRPADVRGIHQGCCGPLGTGGLDMACACGALVGTFAVDCLGPYELHLDTVRVHALPGVDET
ncbi:hypothetical protein [Streptomyces sp. NPDC017859]|uniref:hypothetical protein n=1 Tax=unclassified Streptomyces TaxID=2593676 RepID=UPI0037976337